MKTTLLHGWRWMVAGSGAFVLLGCLDKSSNTNAQNNLPNSSAVAGPLPAGKVEEEIPPVRAIIAPANLSPDIAEVVKLAQSGVGDEVLLAYVDKSGRSFNPSVDEIVYLKDLGLSEAVMASLVRQRTENISPSSIADSRTSLPNQNSSNVPVAPSAQLSTSANEPAYNEPPLVSAPATPPQEVNVDYFENTLSPYGNWIEVADYGRCWQPTVVLVNSGWRPYSDRGRWIYTSSGWYWQSDYSWGWAAFHYGRWHRDSGFGWVWVPGSTWGPSWVSWRYTDDYCGWAPLPPSAHFDGGGFRYRNAHVGISFDFGLHADFYSFLPTRNFCDRTPSRYYVSGNHSKTIYKNSVVVNNYISGNNNTVINQGISRDRISKVSRTPINTVALRELPKTSAPTGRADKLEGNALTVFRPNVSDSRVRHSDSRLSASTGTVSTEKLARPLSPLAKKDAAIGSTYDNVRQSKAAPAPSVQPPPSALRRESTINRAGSTSRNESASTSPIATPPVSRDHDRSLQTTERPLQNSSPRIRPGAQPSVPGSVSAPLTPRLPRGNSEPRALRSDENASVQNSGAANSIPRSLQRAEVSRQRESVPQQNVIRGEPVLSPRGESVRRDPDLPTRSYDNSAPRSLRSMGAENSQPTYRAPENINREVRSERPAVAPSESRRHVPTQKVERQEKVGREKNRN
ncbi:MAG: DUF6600 domain-containing protein [Verrucomicrobiota bacterium]